MSEKKKKVPVSYEELAYSNMLTLTALVELLAEKGVLTHEEILERMRKLQTETRAKRKRIDFQPGRSGLSPTWRRVSRGCPAPRCPQKSCLVS